jgi:hypothetical protein
MSWWAYVLFALAVAAAIYGFCALVGLETRVLTRKPYRTADDLYDKYADSTRKQRRSASEHGGPWSDVEDNSFHRA